METLSRRKADNEVGQKPAKDVASSEVVRLLTKGGA